MMDRLDHELFGPTCLARAETHDCTYIPILCCTCLNCEHVIWLQVREKGGLLDRSTVLRGANKGSRRENRHISFTWDTVYAFQVVRSQEYEVWKALYKFY